MGEEQQHVMPVYYPWRENAFLLIEKQKGRKEGRKQIDTKRLVTGRSLAPRPGRR